MTLNNSPEVDDSGEQAAPLIDANLRAGLALLRQAHLYALDAGADLWDFALENDHLYETGLTISDLRWLVAKKFAGHGQEISFYGDPHRSFRLSDGLNFVPTTCFVLTPKGVEFAGKALKEPTAPGLSESRRSHPYLKSQPPACNRPSAAGPRNQRTRRSGREIARQALGRSRQSTPDRHQRATFLLHQIAS